MANEAGRLYRALTATGLPVVSVSIGTVADRATWRVDYAAAATAQQRADGEALKASFDADSVAAVDAEIADSAKKAAAVKDRLADIALMIRYKDPVAWNALTLAQKKAAVQAQQGIWEGMRDFIEKNV